MRIDISGILQSVVSKCRSDTDLDHWLLEECRSRHGKQHATVYKAVSDVLQRHAGHCGGSRLAAAREIAGGGSLANVQEKSTVESHTYSSLDEMSPEVRRRVEEMMRDGKTHNVTETVRHYDSSDGRPPGPEIVRAMREHLDGQAGPTGATLVTGHGGGASKWLVLLVLLFLLIGVPLLLIWLKARPPPRTSVPARTIAPRHAPQNATPRE